MAVRFVCSGCAKCCTEWGMGIEKGWNAEAAKQGKGLGENIIISTAPEETPGLPLEEWEAERFRKIAEERKISLGIIPAYAVFDMERGISLVYKWKLAGNSCPFIKDKRCSVYADRPLKCRSYPLFVESIGKDGLKLSFLMCSQNRKELLGINEAEKFKESYGNTYRYAYNSYQIRNYKNSALRQLIERGVIRPAVRQPVKTLLRQAESGPKIGLFEFMAGEGLLSRELHEKNIRAIENFNIEG